MYYSFVLLYHCQEQSTCTRSSSYRIVLALLTRCFGKFARGSSPHVWGVLSSARTSSSVPSVHPHMCGEYVSSPLSGSIVALAGSPPHVWGVRSVLSHFKLLCRFTPTCVGSTRPYLPSIHRLAGSPPHVWGVLQSPHSSPHSSSVHPHMCGEYPAGRITVSSRFRFTPTCVGSTSSPCISPPKAPVHPHMCGEYVQQRWVETVYPGSPPHVWGVHY